ncbi:MAG: FixH family protein [Planctomycetes bacterium]|nr:FixH family protein [Planctomycetota bacterium]
MVSPRTFWVGMIVGLLGLSVGVNLYVLFAFGESPKDSLEEDWEARAENWNEYQEQHTENRKLGWKLDVIEEEPQGAGPITFPLNLLDKDKKPIQGAKITLVMSHNAHYSERQRVEATELEPGRYRFDMQVPYEGRWEFHGEVHLPGASAEAPETVFTQVWTERLHLTPAQ